MTHNSSYKIDSLLSCRSQVCERCRRLKKKCYGTGPNCNNCLISNNECQVTTLLKRKRKPKPTKLSPMEIENVTLKLKLKELEDKLSITNNNTSNHDPLIKNFIYRGEQFCKQIEKLINKKIIVPDTSLLITENSDDKPNIFQEYSIVNNFLQQDFIKILKEQKNKTNFYLDKFFSELNILFPIISKKEYFLEQVEELMGSIDIRNFNTNMINDENNLCIVYKTILICMLYIKDTNLKVEYLKISSHLLSRFESLNPISSLECYLLTHLFAQLNENRLLIIKMNGLMSSLALSLKLYSSDDLFESQLWFTCCCFDFFVNDPLLTLEETFNLIPDYKLPKDEFHPLITLIKIRKKIFKDELSIDKGLTQLLDLTYFKKLVDLNIKQSYSDLRIFKYDFLRVSISLYYLDTLITMKCSQMSNSIENMDELTKYMDIFIKIWFVNIPTYQMVPFINLSKIFQAALFLYYYVKSNNSKDSQFTSNLDGLKVSISMAIKILYEHSLISKNVVNYHTLLKSLLSQDINIFMNDKSIFHTPIIPPFSTSNSTQSYSFNSPYIITKYTDSESSCGPVILSSTKSSVDILNLKNLA